MSLLSALQKSQNARKIFGRRELVIIEKQLRGVPLTQSEKNRLSRDIRKKLEAVRELVPYEQDFRLKKGAETSRLIAGAVEGIVHSVWSQKIRKIVLFGSVAEQTQTLRSDIDLAVVFHSLSQQDAVRFRRDMLSFTGDRFDIQVWNTLPEKIRKEISEKGRVIYERQNKRQNH